MCGLDVQRNCVHGSDSPLSAAREISFFFNEPSSGNSVADHVLEEDLEDTTSLFVDEIGDMLHSTTASQTTNGLLRDSLDVVPENLTVSFRSSLSQTLTALSMPRHLRKFLIFFAKEI
nr:probable nucleoside diphosphate kinase 5 [Ipomoea batatas]